MTVGLSNRDAEALVARMQQGDVVAAESFASDFGDRLRRFFLWHGVAPWLAEDLAVSCVSDIVVKVHRFVSRGPGSFVGWCFRIAQNKLADSRREQRRTPPLSSLPDLPEPELVSHADPPGALQQAVSAALDALPEGDREILLLRHFSVAATFAEIAQSLGISPVATRARYLRARKRLAAGLRSHGPIEQWLARRPARAEEAGT